jgi:nucleoside-diphosphate-sugar epimerase
MPNDEQATVVVTGATSMVGRFLLPRLVQAGYRVQALSRKDASAATRVDGVRWHTWDEATGLVSPALDSADAVLHLAPLWILPEVFDTFIALGINRLIAFGSTSRFTKADSADPGERQIAGGLEEAEAWLERACESHEIAWTVFRPTMIYGTDADKTITTMRQFIRRYGFLPLPGKGEGRRQPVHADDLARACVDALECCAAHNRAYNLTGGDVLTFRELVEALFAWEGKPARIVTLPAILLEPMVWLAGRVSGLRHINATMLQRIEQDLVFDCSDAVRDFGFAPRRFPKRPTDIITRRV